jgi:hypothetical protein
MVDGLTEAPAMGGIDGDIQIPHNDSVSALGNWEIPQSIDGVPDRNGGLMSERDLEQLSGYVASFH